MDEKRPDTEPLTSDEEGREAYEPPAVESLGGVYGQTQQTFPP